MKRLFIDLEICSKCTECKAACSYFYHPHNNGIDNLREFATFSLLCRRCEEAPCVNSCYHNALEKQPDGVLKRYAMRCTSCKTCTLACPFGVIMPEFIPYIASKCDYCISKKEQKLPECATSCNHKAITIKEIEEDPFKNIFFVGENLAVHSRKWLKEDMPLKK